MSLETLAPFGGDDDRQAALIAWHARMGQSRLSAAGIRGIPVTEV